MTSALAQLNVPSDGSDGAFNVTADSVIDLSQATTGTWNSPGAGKGVYDPNKWAVVFKFSSVNISGVTPEGGILTGNNVTFLNHPSHAPVVWLVQGDVTINGIVNLDGQAETVLVPQSYTPAEPGPGGFRGGSLGPSGVGDGYGPGAGRLTFSAYSDVLGYSGIYGNPQILPLIGGSGAGAYSFSGDTAAGAAGGGAILIVAGGTVTINGRITAVGTGFTTFVGGKARASGGAIKIIADKILGSGTVDASGSSRSGAVKSPSPFSGRTRMETGSLSPSLNIFPNTSAVAPGVTPIIWPADNAPTVSVVSVDAAATPADPVAAVAGSADIGINNDGPVDILLVSKNLPIQGSVALRITPKYGEATVLAATFVSGDVTQATWKITTKLPQGFVTLQARATAP